MRTLPILVVAFISAVLAFAAPAHAQRTVIDVETKAKRGLYPIAVPLAVEGDPATNRLVADVQSFDFAVSSWFKVLDPRSFLADLRSEGLSIEPQKWKDIGAFAVVKSRAQVSGGNLVLTFKLYELEKGAVPTLEREYKGTVGEARKLTHKWANEVVRHFTGEPGFFGSKIVFTANKRVGKAILGMDFDGHGVWGVSRNSSVNMLAAWSPSGAVIAYTSYMRANPDLYLAPAGGGRPKRISLHPGMNTGASFSPDGSKIALTLSKDGNPEIYVISASDGKIIKRLTKSRYIDTSPAWSPDGREIAFVSDREGGPQVFVMNAADGSGVRRVTTAGKFNQTPAWNPRKGTRQIAYSGRDDLSGRFDIFVVDLDTKKMTRITQNQGSNEEPTWAPNGRAIAFASVRSGGSGIYIANADGSGEQHRVYKGDVTSPDWGPAP